MDEKQSDLANGLRAAHAALRDASKSAAEIALDDIAAACGCARWEYPGQVTRDVLGVVARLEAAQSILKGRTTPPTEAEREAHRKAGGSWRCVVTIDGKITHMGLHFDRNEFPPSSVFDGLLKRRGIVYIETWWALDATGALCAWPVVVEVAR